jgi:RHH-type rel operon transcriptional repressor/antitoxin RelB
VNFLYNGIPASWSYYHAKKLTFGPPFVYNEYKNYKRTQMSTVISVRLSKELSDELENISKETERPRSYIIQKALESYIEDYADLQIALDRLHDKSDRVISSQEMRKSLGI